MAHFIYILQCSDASLYVGYATDVEKRLDVHQSGRGGAYTSKRLPANLVFQEELPSLDFARKRERQLKRWKHAKKLALIAGDLPTLKSLSRSTRIKARTNRSR